MRRPLSILALVAVFALLGCEDDGTGPIGQDLDVATFEVVTGDITTLARSPIRVVGRTVDGLSVVDFESVGLEYQAAGGAWTPLALSLDGSQNCYDADPGPLMTWQCIDGSLWTAWNTFTSSGTYSLRATAARSDGPFTANATLEVERISISAGGYDVGFESYPGDVRVGQPATFEFYVTDGATMAEQPCTSDGACAPILDLDALVICLEPDGAKESHQAQHEGNGAYSAPHTFAEAGIALITLQFEGADGNPAEVTFEVNVLE